MARLRESASIGCAVAVALAVGAAPAAAHSVEAQGEHALVPVRDGGAQRAGIGACSGEPIAADRVISGSFGPELERSYVMVPFAVPTETTAVRVKYCHDQPALAQLPGTTTVNKHTLDLGMYEARGADELWAEEEFRGWGGSSRKDVTISGEGSIDPDPPPVATEETTVGYLPGPIPTGEWAAELGVGAVGTELPGEDGVVNWRLEIDLISDPAYQDEPYEPVPYETAAADPDPGWYAGDLHVHARHSAPGDAMMRETFDYSFCPDPALGDRCSDAASMPGAGLDFITLSDYVTDRAWGEIGAFQDDYPGKLIVRSSEVITYRGHTNNQASGEFVDYRTGPVYEAEPTGPATDQTVGEIDADSPARPARPASAILADVLEAGGWTQLNHVETFPSEVPFFGNFCRGCSWEYSDEETQYPLVDSIEVATGPGGVQEDPNPGPNPFTPLAIRFYEEALDADGLNSNRIAALAVSDSHNAGTPNDPVTQSPIGQGTTVVFADELSEAGIREGVKARHTYAKIWGADGPDLRLDAKGSPGAAEAIIGDEIRADSVAFEARVLGLARASAARPGQYVLSVVRDGNPFISVPIPPGVDRFSFPFASVGPGRYRLQVDRTASGAGSVEAVSSPIWHLRRRAGGPGPGPGPGPKPGPEPARCEPRITGTEGDDRLTGTENSETLAGRGGDDVIVAQPGPDCIRGGPGEDRIQGGLGADRATGGADADRIVGAQGRDRLTGGRSSDRLLGEGGRDRLFGKQGRDRLAGGGAGDLLRGAAGRDRLDGGAGEDRILAGSGKDEILARGGDDTIEAADGQRDVVRCGAGIDTVRADSRDVLRGCEQVRRG